MLIRALYYDGKTSTAHPVNLSLIEGNLAVRGEDGLEFIWPFENIKSIEPPSPTTPLRLKNGYHGAERLVISDATTHEEIIRHFPRMNERDKIWSQNAKRLVGWGTAAMVSLVFTVLVAIPLIATQIADNLPASFEKEMGEQAYEQILKTLTFIDGRNDERRLTCGTPGDTADVHLSQLMARLLTQQYKGAEPLIQVVNFQMQNAFALPGGHIVVFRGLLENLQHPDELAGILAHEIGHVIHRHSTKIFIEQLGTSALVGLWFGDVTGGTAVAGLGQALLNSTHTREAEREADAYALDALNRENISALPAARFFERLFSAQGGMEKGLSLLNTHPMSDARASYFKTNSTGTQPSLSNDAWLTIKNMCPTPPAE